MTTMTIKGLESLSQLLLISHPDLSFMKFLFLEDLRARLGGSQLGYKTKLLIQTRSLKVKSVNTILKRELSAERNRRAERSEGGVSASPLLPQVSTQAFSSRSLDLRRCDVICDVTEWHTARVRSLGDSFGDAKTLDSSTELIRYLKLATVNRLKADVSSVSPSSELALYGDRVVELHYW